MLFFKDPIWALTLLEQMESPLVDRQSGQPLLPRMANFKPDEVFPVKDCIAVYDASYSEVRPYLRALRDLSLTTQHPHTFRFVMPSHRQYLLQAADEAEMNEWINLVNYSSVFKTAGVRMRGMSMGKDRAVLAGAAAAASHKRDLQAVPRNDDQVRMPRRPVFGADPMETTAYPSRLPPKGERASEEDEVSGKRGILAVDAGNDVVNEGEQLEEVFDVVKAELAAGRGGATRKTTSMDGGEEMKRTASETHASRAGHIQVSRLQPLTSIVLTV